MGTDREIYGEMASTQTHGRAQLLSWILLTIIAVGTLAGIIGLLA